MFCIYSDTRDLPRLQSSTPSPSVRLPSLFDALMPSFSVAYFVVESVGVNAAAQLNSLLTQLTLLDGQNRFPLWLSFCCTLFFRVFLLCSSAASPTVCCFIFRFVCLGFGPNTQYIWNPNPRVKHPCCRKTALKSGQSQPETLGMRVQMELGNRILGRGVDDGTLSDGAAAGAVSVAG